MSTRYAKRKLNYYIGQIGETLAWKFLREQGFEIISYSFLVEFKPHFNSKFRGVRTGVEFVPNSISAIKKFLGSKKQDFVELVDALDKEYSGFTHKKRRFDFVAKKEGKYYLVEVKTNKGRLSKLQKEEMEKSKKFGFIPLIVRTKVTLIADMKDVKVKTL